MTIFIQFSVRSHAFTNTNSNITRKHPSGSDHLPAEITTNEMRTPTAPNKIMATKL